MGQMALMSIFSWLIDKQQTNKREGKNLGRNGNEWRCRQVKWWTVVDRLPGRRPSISRVADVRKGVPRVCKVDRSNRDDRDSMTATRTEEETHGGNHTTLFLWSITATKMPQWKKKTNLSIAPHLVDPPLDAGQDKWQLLYNEQISFRKTVPFITLTRRFIFNFCLADSTVTISLEKIIFHLENSHFIVDRSGWFVLIRATKRGEWL